LIASKIASRVFSSAQTPVAPGVPKHHRRLAGGLTRPRQAHLGRIVVDAVNAGVVELFVVGESGVRVRAGDDAVLERVDTQVLLPADAVDQSVAHVAVVDLADHAAGAEHVLEAQLEVGELVVRRQGGVGVRLPLGLEDLHHGLVRRALLGPRFVDRGPVGVARREHHAVADVGVVRDREGLVTHVALDLEIGPQVFRPVRVNGREGRLGSLVVPDVASS
jgi:hypothetical protein